MTDLPAAWPSLCVTVFLLGMRHGLDADHLATIDGLTRLNRGAERRFARWCGALFSLGHGAVVMAIASVVGEASGQWAPPPWLDTAGAAMSIGFLMLLGAANLRAATTTPTDTVVRLVGLKGALVVRVLGARSPWAVAGVGALFALSFDTIGQAALFALTATRFGGIGRALELGALFTAGMLLSDGLHGWIIAHLIDRADRSAARASRIMSIAVAAASLAVAALGVARLLWHPVDEWTGGRELMLGLAVIALTVVAYAVARFRLPRLAKTSGNASGPRLHA